MATPLNGTTNLVDANADASIITSLDGTERFVIGHPATNAGWITTLDDVAEYAGDAWGGSLGGADDDAIHVNEADEIHGIAAKGTPVDADVLVIEDSAASWAKKSVTFTALATYVSGEIGDSIAGSDADAIHSNVAGEIVVIDEKDPIVGTDIFVIEDSEDTLSSYPKVRVKASTLGDYILELIEGNDSLLGSGGETAQVTIWSLNCPATSAPLLESHAGGSTPGEVSWAYTFGQSADTYLGAHAELSSSYSGGGLTFRVRVRLSESAIVAVATGTVRVGLAIRRLDTAEDFDAAHSYQYNSADVAFATSDAKQHTATITFTDGADMDSLAAGEPFCLYFRREGTHVNDDLGGRIEFVSISGEETSA